MMGILDDRAVGMPTEESREHHFFLVIINFLSQVKQATNQIVMNCADIDIITASYAPEGDEGRIAFCWSFYTLIRLVSDVRCCCQQLTTRLRNCMIV